MPTRPELRSIVNYSRSNPSIDATYFRWTRISFYWSASLYAPLTGYAWDIDFSNGDDAASDKNYADAVRLVRGGQSYTPETTPTSDFILDDVNGTAYHQKTGLTWMRCAMGQGWDSVNKTCTGTAAMYAWPGALNQGIDDWRLPNFKELESIVEERNWAPAINATVFPNTPVSIFWSASPYAPNAGYMWNVDFNEGHGSISDWSTAYPVRLVRGGQYAFLSVLKTGTGSGTVGGGGTFPYNTTVTPNATAAAGSTLTGWSPTRCGAPFALTDNTTCTATFTLNNYTLTVNQTGTGSGMVSGGGAYPYNTTVTPTATADAGSTFTGWSPASCGSPFPLTADTTCTATFALNTHTVTVRAGANGNVTRPTQPVSHGATTTLTVTPDAGYTVRVLGCGGALSGTTYTTGPITTDCTVTARFTRPGETFPTTTGGDAFSTMNNASGSAAYATGDNTWGQLGAGSTTSSPSQARPQAFVGRSIYPVRVRWASRRASRSVEVATAVPLAAADTPDFIALASAATHTIALRGDGTVWAWGDNANGQLGDGTTNPAYEPVQVMADSSSPLTGVIAIAAGRDHSVAVKSDGTVWTWGDNTYGQLGDSSFSTTQRDYPVQVRAGDAPNLSFLTGVRAVAASDIHTLALKTDGTVWAWGNNDAGQLGVGTTAERRTAAPVPGLNDVQAITARGTSSSSDHAASPRNLAQRRDGSVWGWGDNTDCELGETTEATTVLVPVRLANLSNLGLWVGDIAQGDAHGIASTPDGVAWTWGRNNQGQLGNGATTTQCAPIPVPGASAVETVGTGADHTFVTTRDGWVWGWGRNDRGQLGVGDTNPRLTPTQMRGENGVDFLNLKVEPPPTLTGDVTGDDRVDALDVVAVINAVLGIQPSPAAADVNSDGNVNALDVVFVINQVLGL